MGKQKDLFIAFFRSGIVGFGGGPTTIPLVHKEVVGVFGFMTDDEFTEVQAIGNTLPGPIITKMAGYIGYRVGGIIGLVNAVIAATLPSAVMMICLLVGLNSLQDISFIKGMTYGVLPVMAVMMGVLMWNYFKKVQKGFGQGTAIGLLAVLFVLMIVCGISPAIIIIVSLLLALLLPVKRGNKA